MSEGSGSISLEVKSTFMITLLLLFMVLFARTGPESEVAGVVLSQMSKIYKTAVVARFSRVDTFIGMEI